MCLDRVLCTINLLQTAPTHFHLLGTCTIKNHEDDSRDRGRRDPGGEKKGSPFRLDVAIPGIAGSYLEKNVLFFLT